MDKKSIDAGSLSKTSTELIVYQIGEIKNLLTEAKSEWKGFRDDIDKRVQALEIWQAGEIENKKNFTQKPIDVQKIILAALGIASGAIALALGLVQSGIIK